MLILKNRIQNSLFLSESAVVLNPRCMEDMVCSQLYSLVATQPFHLVLGSKSIKANIVNYILDHVM